MPHKRNPIGSENITGISFVTITTHFYMVMQKYNFVAPVKYNTKRKILGLKTPFRNIEQD